MAIPVPIRDFLHQRHVDFSVVTHPTAYTAQEEAAVTHVPGREWAKTVVCFADNEPVLAVLPAHFTVDFERLRAATGASRIRLASETEMVTLYPGVRSRGDAATRSALWAAGVRRFLARQRPRGGLQRGNARRRDTHALRRVRRGRRRQGRDVRDSSPATGRACPSLGSGGFGPLRSGDGRGVVCVTIA